MPSFNPLAARRSKIASSSRDLAMLRIAPIDSAPLPRAHVARRQAGGSFRIHDRPGGEDVLVYTPTFRTQFEAGHRAGRWYVRPVTSVGGSPRSLAFPTAREAVEAVERGAWRLRLVARDEDRPVVGNRRAPGLRVIWEPADAAN